MGNREFPPTKAQKDAAMLLATVGIESLGMDWAKLGSLGQEVQYQNALRSIRYMPDTVVDAMAEAWEE